MAGNVFKRYELKYRMNAKQYDTLMGTINDYLVSDQYGESTICSLYFDTPDHILVRRSIEKPEYKEKLRLRSYGAASDDSEVFIELKKKYDGIVYKRRNAMTYSQAKEFLSDPDDHKYNQIAKEIDYFIRFYPGIKPAALICYDRTAYVAKEDKDLRITFDRNIRYRTDRLTLDDGLDGTPIIGQGEVLMELKVTGAIPLWLVHAMNQNKIYKDSFSKYGTAYERELRKGKGE